MDWYYAAENKTQVGPLSDQEFESKVAQGTITPDTLVWNETMSDWLPYAKATGSPQATASPHSEQAFESEDPEDKLEKVDDAASLLNAVERDRQQFEISVCLSYAWKLLNGGFFLLAGTALIMIVIPYILGMMVKNPYAITGIHAVIQGPILGGIFFVFISRLRGEPVGFENAFYGFTNQTKQLIIGGLPLAIPALLMLPGSLYMQEQMLELEQHAKDPEAVIAAFQALLNDSKFVSLMLMPIIPSLYIGVISFHIIPLIVGTRLGARDAIITSVRTAHSSFLSHLGLIIMASVVSWIGILACGVGILATYPLYFGMIAYAYESIFGPYRVSNNAAKSPLD